MNASITQIKHQSWISCVYWLGIPRLKLFWEDKSTLCWSDKKTQCLITVRM